MHTPDVEDAYNRAFYIFYHHYVGLQTGENVTQDLRRR
jgi:hypothetical protein